MFRNSVCAAITAIVASLLLSSCGGSSSGGQGSPAATSAGTNNPPTSTTPPAATTPVTTTPAPTSPSSPTTPVNPPSTSSSAPPSNTPATPPVNPWYDYGLAVQLDRLKKYGKSIWLTEFANWHAQNNGAQIDTLAKQEAQVKEMVAICESRSDVFRYAWFTGRWSNDVHFTSLLSTPGQLTDLGKLYLSLPYSSQ